MSSSEVSVVRLLKHVYIYICTDCDDYAGVYLGIEAVAWCYQSASVKKVSFSWSTQPPVWVLIHISLAGS